MLIAELRIPHRASPWRAPTVTKRGNTFKDKHLLAWQSTVAAYARVAMAGRDPYAGAVEVRCEFYLTRRARGGVLPDLSNLVKATEDALQGIVIRNDRQVVRNGGERAVADADMTVVRVESVD